MPKKLLSVLKYLIIFGLTGYLLHVSFEEIDEGVLKEGESKLDFVLNTWKEGDKLFFFLSAVFTVLSHVFRAERWKLLLEPLDYKPSLWNSFTAVMNGYFVNLVVPRGGEVSRPVTLYKLENVPVGTSIGTVVLERIIDVVFLLLCIGTVFLFQFGVLIDFFEQMPKGEQGGYVIPLWMKAGVAAGIVGIIAAIILFKVKRELFQKIKDKLVELGKGFKSGITSIFSMERKFLFIVHSLLIWICYFMMLWMILLAFKETEALGFIDALTIFVVGGIALALPTPGGAGTYHKMVPMAMVALCGLDNKAKGVAFATIFHGWQTLIVILLGMIGLIVINSKTKANADKA